MSDDFLDRHDKIQRINKWKGHTANNQGFLYALCLIAIPLAIISISAQSCEQKTEPRHPDCSQCHNRTAAMTEYFRKNGSKSPEEMAYGVLQSKRNSRLLASIAVVESGGNPDKRNTGYKRRHHGAFQVNPRHWGAVPRDAAGQSVQAEAILNELTQTMPIKKALSAYGGDSTSRYQRTVLAELTRVP